MAVSNGGFAAERGFNEYEGEQDGVFLGQNRQNSTDTGSFSTNTDDENGEWDALLCHEEANQRIRLTPKKNQQEAKMAEVLLDKKPIGLKLHNLPYLQEKIEQRLSYSTYQPGNTSHAKVDENHISPKNTADNEKLKATNFAATLLRIGSWERVQKYEGDLVAKCYFAKKKLVWEFLERGLKSKMEISWSDILGMRAHIQKNQPGILEIEVSKPPTFHEETVPQPRKHTMWRLTTDFTGGEASKWRKHHLRFPPGTLNKHYPKLLQADSRLREISQKPFPTMKSPIFESNSCGSSGFSLSFNGSGEVRTNHPEMHWPIQMNPHQVYVQNKPHYPSFMNSIPLSFHETPSNIPGELGGGIEVFESSSMAMGAGNDAYQGLPSTSYHHLQLHGCPDQAFAMNEVQVTETFVSSTTRLDQNVPFGQNCNLVPYDQTMESSQPYLLGGMQDQLLTDRTQVGLYDNNYQLAGVAPLNAPVNLATEQRGHSTSASDQTLFGEEDIFTEENLDYIIPEYANDQLGSFFDELCDPQQQIVTCNVPTQLSSQDILMHDLQFQWNNTAYPSSLEGYDHHGNPVNGVNRSS